MKYFTLIAQILTVVLNALGTQRTETATAADLKKEAAKATDDLVNHFDEEIESVHDEDRAEIHDKVQAVVSAAIAAKPPTEDQVNEAKAIEAPK